MISVAEATDRISAAFRPLGTEYVTLDQSLGRVLAHDLLAKVRQPGRDVSSMDGYAVRAEDTRQCATLEVVGEVAAGTNTERALEPGQCVRIFTGAPLPPNADAVLIQENTSRVGTSIRFTTPADVGRYVRPAGLDFEYGWRGLPSSTRMSAQSLGLAASMGHLWLPVLRQPRIGLLATGNELAWPGTTPGPNQHISSNTTTLSAMCRSWGATPVDLGIANDTIGSLLERTADLSSLDLIVTTGGASVGDYDIVRSAHEQAGLELDFWKIAMRPGKPLMFGELRGTLLLGLPGNPVSAAVCGLIFLRAAVRTMLKQTISMPMASARILNDLSANDEREDYLRGNIEIHEGERLVRSAERQDSSMFATFAHSNALIQRPPHDPAKRAGDIIAIVEINQLV